MPNKTENSWFFQRQVINLWNQHVISWVLLSIAGSQSNDCLLVGKPLFSQSKIHSPVLPVIILLLFILWLTVIPWAIDILMTGFKNWMAIWFIEDSTGLDKNMIEKELWNPWINNESFADGKIKPQRTRNRELMAVWSWGTQRKVMAAGTALRRENLYRSRGYFIRNKNQERTSCWPTFYFRFLSLLGQQLLDSWFLTAHGSPITTV